MKRLVCVIILVFFMLPMIVISSSAMEQDTVEFIVTNVDILADVFQQLYPDSDAKFLGTSVEFSIPVTIVNSGAVGTYLDFNDNNGYMIIANSNDVIEWKCSGDLEFLRTLESTFYCVSDGFGYYSGDVFISYESDSIDDTLMIPKSAYDGQILAGEGTIIDPYAYMDDRYNSEYLLTEINFLSSSFFYAHMSDYSVYDAVNSSGGVTGEGNCTLTAVFAALNYLKSSNKCPSLPDLSANVIHHAEYDPFYEKYENNTGYVINNPITLPVLYYATRHRAIDNYSYERYGINDIYIDNLIEDVSETYDAGITASQHTLGSFNTYVDNNIAIDMPVILCVDGGQTYDCHAMVVTGYRLYEKTTTILGIDFKDYVTLLRISDGWGRTERYLDWTAFDGTWSFITMEID